jgi:hypothetical protein
MKMTGALVRYSRTPPLKSDYPVKRANPATIRGVAGLFAHGTGNQGGPNP